MNNTAMNPTTSNGTGTGKPGAPPGNSNRMRHGLRAAQLPRDAKYIENATNALRRQLEAAVGTEVGVRDAALIQSAVRHERRAALAERWLRTEPDLPLSDRLSILKTVSDATDARDKCLSRLPIDRDDQQTIFAQLYSQQPPQAVADSETSTATDATTGDSGPSDGEVQHD